MAKTKIPFSKLSLKKLGEVRTVNYEGFDIEITQYLPIEQKLILIGNVINEAADMNNFMNPIKTDLFATLEIIENYTNITFTDKQKEDPAKLYDLLVENDLVSLIFDEIPKEEFDFVYNGIIKCSEAIYSYRNSAYGVINALSSEYDDLNLDASKIQEKLADPENLKTIKDVLDKLG